MGIFIGTFAIMLLMAGGLGLGLMLRNQELQGSCGGISNLGVDKACDCDDPCDKRKAKMAAQEQQRIRDENRII